MPWPPGQDPGINHVNRAQPAAAEPRCPTTGHTATHRQRTLLWNAHLVLAIFAGGTIITLLGERAIAARVGRRGAMLGGVATMMVAAGLLAARKELPGLLIGRLLTGVAVGLAAGVAIPYLIELRLRADPDASAARARNIGTSVNVGALGAVALIGVAAAPETGEPAARAAPTTPPAGSRRSVRLPVPAGLRSPGG